MFDTNKLAWDNAGEAVDAMWQCLNADINAVLLVSPADAEEWEEATPEDTERTEALDWQITDEGGNTILVPQSAFDADENLDDLDAPAPAGFVWIVP